MQETQAQSVNREDPLEKEMATHPRILAWEILWTEELGDSPTLSGAPGNSCLKVFDSPLFHFWVWHAPAVQETRVRSLGWEDPLEKEMATHPSILAWKISWTEEPGGLPSMGVTKSWARLSN